MGLVAMTGGQSVVITDTFASAGLEIPTLSEASYDELKGFFISSAAVPESADARAVPPSAAGDPTPS